MAQVDSKYIKTIPWGHGQSGREGNNALENVKVI